MKKSSSPENTKKETVHSSDSERFLDACDRVYYPATCIKKASGIRAVNCFFLGIFR